MSDDHLKSVLGQLEYPFEPESWEILNSKLDSLTDPPAVAAVDRAVYTTLNKLRAHQQPEGWHLLGQSIQRIQRRSQTIMWIKAAESILLAVLIWGSTSFFGSLDLTDAEEAFQASEFPDSAPISLAYNSDVREMPLADRSISPTPPIQLRDREPEDLHADDAVYFMANPTDVYEENKLVHTVQATSYLELPQLTNELSSQEAYGPHVPDITHVTIARSAYWSLGMFAEQGRFSSGIAADRYDAYGILAITGIRKGKWQYQTGLNLGKYALSTLPVEEYYAGDVQTSYIGHKLVGSRAIVASLPMQVQRQLLIAGKFRASAMSGLTTHFTLHRADDYQGIRITPPQGAGQPSVPGWGKPQVLTEEKGLFQGGTLNKNTWASAQLGLQLEYPIGPDKRIFFQQTASRDLGSARLGPLPRHRTYWSASAGIQVNF